MNVKIPLGPASIGAAITAFTGALSTALVVVFTPHVSANDAAVAIGAMLAAVPPLTVAIHGRMEQAKATIYTSGPLEPVLSDAGDPPAPKGVPVVVGDLPVVAQLTAAEHLAAALTLLDHPATPAADSASDAA